MEDTRDKDCLQAYLGLTKSIGQIFFIAYMLVFAERNKNFTVILCIEDTGILRLSNPDYLRIY